MHGEDVSSQRQKEIVLFDDIAQLHFEVAKTSYKDPDGPIQRYEHHIKKHIGHKNVNEITKFDIEQKEAAFAEIDGPQRIRGLAVMFCSNG
jgi:superfamily I DNA and RNA helicase